MDDSLDALRRDVITCHRCPRLVAHRERVASEKKRAFRDEPYWGKPVPGFGDPYARVLLIGLAPAAHGANRTGRMFTGDVPGGAADFLIAALYRAGFANQSTSHHADDGLELTDTYLTAIARCAPPKNRPTSEEIDQCAEYLDREFALLTHVRAIVALGGMAFDQTLRLLHRFGASIPSSKPRFAHGAVLELDGMPSVIAAYHPSRQNTQTGRLTPEMLDEVFAAVRARLV
ncbi:MAG: uracil-DNA glycosylase [Candidatus Bipolaricaulia bacterium]